VARKRINGHLRPLQGGLRVDEVTMQAAKKAFRSICEGKHAGKAGSKVATGLRARVSDLLCMTDPVHASATGSMTDHLERSPGRTSEGRGAP
jgi:predicted alpha/beta-hydrolase family hydrolase